MWILYKSPPELKLQEQELREVQGQGDNDILLALLSLFFSCAPGTSHPVTEGWRTWWFPKAQSVSCSSVSNSLKNAVQVSSPKFIGRAGSSLGSVLRGGFQWVDSWGNSSWGRWGKLRLAKSLKTHSRCRCGRSQLIQICEQWEARTCCIVFPFT